MATILAAVDFAGIAKWVGVAGVAIIGIAMAFKGAISASVVSKRPDYGRGAAGVFLGSCCAHRRVGGARYVYHHRQDFLMAMKNFFSCIAVFCMLFFVMVQPVKAESVAPNLIPSTISAPTAYYNNTGSPVFTRNSALRVCQDKIAYHGWIFVSLTGGNCNGRTSAGGTIFALFTIISVVHGAYCNQGTGMGGIGVNAWDEFGIWGYGYLSSSTCTLVNSSAVHRTCPIASPSYIYNSTSGMCERPDLCPAHASGTPCACDAGYQFDAAGTSCVPVVACPVPALTAPPFNDACAEVLENINSTQAQKDAACGALTPALQAGKACLEAKLAGMSPAIPMKITGDIRNIAYQAHLREIWDKMERLVRLENDPDKRAACATRRAEIAAEKGCDNAGPCESCYAESAIQRSHCLKGRPAYPNPNDAQHTQGNAFDVSEARTIEPLLAALGARNPPETIPQFLDAPPANCNLNWGGSFTDNYDPIHFYAR